MDFKQQHRIAWRPCAMAFVSALMLGCGGAASDDAPVAETWVFARAEPLELAPKNTFQETGLFVYDWVVADLNGNGHTDLLTNGPAWAENGDSFNGAQIPLTVLLGDGSGGFSDGAPRLFPDGVPTQVHTREIRSAADFDGDGINDIVLIGHGYDAPPWPGEPIQLLLSNHGQWLDASNRIPTSNGFFHSSMVLDANHDRHADILVLAMGGKHHHLYLGDGNGRFTEGDLSHLGDLLISADVVSSDGRSCIDQDKWYETPVNGKCSRFHTGETTEAIDMDGDGLDDIILSGNETRLESFVSWGQNASEHEGWFAPYAERLILPPVENFELVVDVQAVDLQGRGDGQLDLIISRTGTGYQNWYIQVLRQTSSRTFVDVTSQWLPEQPDFSADDWWAGGTTGKWRARVQLADLDLSGYPDLVMLVDLGDSWENSLVYRNTGEQFEKVIAEGGQQQLNHQLVPIDVDSDGDTDLLQRYTGEGGVRWNLIRNTTRLKTD